MADLVLRPSIPPPPDLGEPKSGLEQAFRSWGLWAAGVTYVLSVVACFWLMILAPDEVNNPARPISLVDRIHIGIVGGLAVSFVPAALMWLPFDILQACWTWLAAPPPALNGPGHRSWLVLIAGPGRLGLLIGAPALCGLVGIAFDPGKPLTGMVVGTLLVGLPLGYLLAFLLTVFLWVL
jgi:hypothetical protein